MHMNSKTSNEQEISQEIFGGYAQEVRRNSDERRRHTRYPFTGTFEGFELNSETRIQGRTTDLSEGGCYVDTMSPFPAGTAVKVRISKDKRSFEAHATVIYSATGMGMGLRFDSMGAPQAATLKNWLAEARGEVVAEVEAEETHTATFPSTDKASVLNELIAELMRKGVLNDSMGRQMLHRLS
jgi:hypothetical protein